MILRQSLNFAVHAAAGVVVGALAVIAVKALLDSRNRALAEPAPVRSASPFSEPPPSEPAAL